MKTEAETSEKTLRHSCVANWAGIWTSMAQLHFLHPEGDVTIFFFALLA